LAKPVQIVVLVKAVPDIEQVRFDESTGRIDRRNAKLEANPFDLNALEAAVRIKEQQGGTVSVLSMGPPQAEEVLKDTIARGADRAILMTDEAFAGADTWATSNTLMGGVKKLGQFDLILAGEKTVDGDTGQVGPELAALLDVPSECYVDSVDRVGDASIVVTCDYGTHQYVKEVPFPCVISVTKNVASPRLPKLSDKIRSRKAVVGILKAADIVQLVDKGHLGTIGSPTHVIKIRTTSESKRNCRILTGEPSAVAKELADMIEGWLAGGA
jgi:electron transfer flavoprotein beta subunit